MTSKVSAALLSSALVATCIQFKISLQRKEQAGKTIKSRLMADCTAMISQAIQSIAASSKQSSRMSLLRRCGK